jgi:uncharacterized protein
VSSLVFGGKPREAVDAVLEDSTVIVSAEILTEARRIIHTKFPIFIEDLARLEKLLKRDGIQVELGSLQVSVCRDPDDNKIIETALIGKCQFIISGDKDLLTLMRYDGVEMITAADFLKID